jgi:hypothetical protein
MPSTSRGFRYPAESDGADPPVDLQKLAEDVQAEFDNALALGGTVSAVDQATVAGAAAAILEQKHNAAGSNLKRIRRRTADGITRTESLNDDGTVKKVAYDVNHGSGTVDFPNGVTVENGLAVNALTVGGVAQLASPYFSAARATSVSYATDATVVFDSEIDPNGWYSTSTGAFLPTVAGMYRLTWQLFAATAITADKRIGSYLATPGGSTRAFGAPAVQRGSGAIAATGTAVLAFNGSTDSVFLHITHDAGGTVAFTSDGVATHFEAERIGV